MKSDGTLWAWGANRSGELGNGQTISKLSPVQIGDNNTLDTWRAVTGGIFYSLGIMSDGTLWSWGQNALGLLGDGTAIDRASPGQVGSDKDWITISGGYTHALAIRARAPGE